MKETPIKITSGSAYVDIDVLACAVSYNELLNKRALESEIILTGPFNSTIPKTITEWKLPISKIPPQNPADFSYILVDISYPKHFEKFVIIDNVIEIFDHHYGHEQFWRAKIDKDAHIESVGSCATLIWEQYKLHGEAENISTLSANLIYTSIISNTLNLRASVTTERDLQALEELKSKITLPDNWVQLYYSETEASIISDTISAIRKDTKKIDIGEQNYVIGQLELWDGRNFVSNKDILPLTMEGLNIKENTDSKWFLTIPSIKEGKNFIITTSYSVKQTLGELLGATFEGPLGTTDKLFLRKEILRELMQHE
jgi:inorganic pyrophosphatase/exopolyphosphatase